jgi:hypothetical protein
MKSILDWNEVSRILKRDLKGCLLVFDDCHKSKRIETFLGIFKEMDGFKGRIVVTTRIMPYFYDKSDTLLKGRIEEIQLEGLDHEATGELVQHSKKGLGTSETVQLYDMTKGHPLFLEFMLARGEKKARKDFESYLHDQILSELSLADENTLRKLCVHRQPVTREAVEGTSSIVLRNLSRMLMLTEKDEKYTVDSTIRAIIYSRLDPQKRKEVHSMAADYYLKSKDDFERLYHLVEAGRFPEAARLCLKRGEGFAEAGRTGEVLDYIDVLEPRVRYTERLSRLKEKIEKSVRKTDRNQGSQ